MIPVELFKLTIKINETGKNKYTTVVQTCIVVKHILKSNPSPPEREQTAGRMTW